MTSIDTPCVRICVVHPTLRLCVGCGRTLDEIARWIEHTDEERLRILAQLPERLVAMRAAVSGAAAAAAAVPAVPVTA
jgi:hypothetical protein